MLNDVQKQLPPGHARTIKCVDDLDELPNVDPSTDMIYLHDLTTLTSSRFFFQS